MSRKYPNVRLEAGSVCQLKCPSCSTATGANTKGLGRGFLSLENFEKFLDLNPETKLIELSNYGEIFLNKDIVEIFRVGFERGVILTAQNGVNLNTVRPGDLEAVVRYQVGHLSCSIDGASQETYKVYRVNGNFDTVIENIKTINAFKKSYDSKYPFLTWQFVVFGHNEHELPVARRMAEDLGMIFMLKTSWDEKFSPIRDKEFVRRETQWEYVTRSEFNESEKEHRNQPLCNQLWDSPQINWDGRVLGCCINSWGEFGGNAFETSLSETLNGESMKYARKMLMGEVPPKSGVPCSTCGVYLAMKKSGSYMDRAKASGDQDSSKTKREKIFYSDPLAEIKK